MKKLWTWIAILIVLSPLGVLLPAYSKAGPAWGEWTASEIKTFAGYLPEGFKKIAVFWSAPMNGYTMKGWGAKGLLHHSFIYFISAVIGTGLVLAAAFIIGKLLTRQKESGNNGRQ